MTGGEIYSPSRLSTFEDCPRRFQYQYVLRIPRAFESIEAFVGKRVHEVLERLYVAVARGHVPSVDQVLRRFDALWEEHFDPDRVKVIREETPVSMYRENGYRALRNFYGRSYPFDADETLGIERRVVFPIDDAGGYRMQGIIDRVVRARDCVLEIHDYKTSARIPSQARLDADRQLAVYQIGLQHERGSDEPVRLVWHYVLLDQVRTSERTPEQLRDLRQQLIELIDRVRAESEWKPRPGPLCAWCAYRSACPASPHRDPDTPDPAAAAPRTPESQLSLL